MGSGTSILSHYLGYLSCQLTALSGKKRSADEADVATREDGAKRRENTGSGKDVKVGLKVRVSCLLGLVVDLSHLTSYSGRGHPSFGFQSARCPTTCRCGSHTPCCQRREQRVSSSCRRHGLTRRACATTLLVHNGELWVEG